MREPCLTPEAEVKKEIHLAQIAPVMHEVLQGGGVFTLTITGMSMFPTLKGGRDRVSLTLAPERFKRGDLPLYRRADGSFVLHRIVAVAKDGTYTCCGDHQSRKEPGLKQSQMIGLVCEIERKGKRFSVQKLGYRFWVRFWMLLRPVRPFFFRLYGIAAGIGRRLRGQRNTKEGAAHNGE